MGVQPRLQFQASRPSAPQSTASKSTVVRGVGRALRPRPQAPRYLVLYRQPQKYYTRSFVQLGSSNTCGIRIQRRCVIGNSPIASVFTKPGVEVPVLS